MPATSTISWMVTSTPPGDPQESSTFDPANPPVWAPHYRCSPRIAVRRFFRKYADFTGRASRSEFWWCQLTSIVGILLLYLLVRLAGIPGADETGSGPGEVVGYGVFSLCLLAIFVPHLTLTVRRLHDVNLSGLLVVLSLIPYLGGLIMVVITLLPPNPEGARFDDPWYRITREGYSTTGADRSPTVGQDGDPGQP